MKIEEETLDMLVAPVIVSWDGNEALLHDSTAFFVYYDPNGKVSLSEHYLPYRRHEIIGLWGHDGAQQKYVFIAYKPGGGQPEARIIPGRKQMVTNNSVLVDSGETVEVQNHQRVIKFLLTNPGRRVPG